MLENVIKFVRSVGIEVEIVDVANGFTPGVEVENGALRIERECKCSALLHEAGHLAIVPSQFRFLMSGDLLAGTRRMFDAIEMMNLPPDHPLQRAALQCSDPEATAWAFAAGRAIGLAPQVIILDSEYDGDGATVRMMLESNQYLGINGLAYAGMCKRGFLVKPEERYPNMLAWTQTASVEPPTRVRPRMR